MTERIAELFGVPVTSALLEEALTHPSYANEVRVARHYQRLEFLGDAVLGLCASELLYERFPAADEGSLTRLRASLVNAEALASWARDQAVGAALRLGRGAEATGLRESTNVLADAVEALVAVSYLEGGLPGAREACRAILTPALALLEADSGRDPKSELQERVQKTGSPAPAYEVTDSGGSAHDPWFSVSVVVAGRKVAEGRGRSKRLAERAAATAALAALADESNVREKGST
ncbi:MAG TPA: ribonuclease III [Polyangiaceae bacterium]|nr:ribonuclease III [Polyangiaceae bacterium]